MKFNKLKLSLIAVCGMAIVAVSCNSDDQSANNSTTNDEKKPAAEAPADARATSTKKGKVSGRIDADDPAVKIEKDQMGYYSRTDVAPAYDGGQTAIEDYIISNLEYPQDAIDNSVEGTVRVRFAVDQQGNVTNVSTVGERLGHGLEEEAVRVVSAMPKWTPGQVKGKNVTTWRLLPINYKLES